MVPAFLMQVKHTQNVSQVQNQCPFVSSALQPKFLLRLFEEPKGHVNLRLEQSNAFLNFASLFKTLSYFLPGRLMYLKYHDVSSLRLSDLLFVCFLSPTSLFSKRTAIP